MAQDLRFAQGFDAAELINQEYRTLGFWGTIVTIGIILLFLATIITLGQTAWLLLLAIIAKGIIALMLLYYRWVYKISD